MFGQMRGRHPTKTSSAPTDLLVCFPTRAGLTLIPKPICSPARLLPLPEPPNPNGQAARPLPPSTALSRRRHKKKFSSPVLWAKSTTKQMGPGPVVSEPTSPKVTCAGQIKVKPRIGGARNWQSVMAEIEKIHGNNGKNKRRPDKGRESSGGGFISKEIVQFLTCLRNVRISFRCFGAFPGAGVVSDDDDEEQDGEEDMEEEEEDEECGGNSKALFSKWFMVLQERRETETKKTSTQQETGERRRGGGSWDDGAFAAASTAPPPNALLLMQCRSAPAKSWVAAMAAAKIEEEEEERGERKSEEEKKKLRLLIDEEKREEEEERRMKQSVLMEEEAYDSTDHYCKMSSDVAKETWVLGSIREALPRSWSSKS